MATTAADQSSSPAGQIPPGAVPWELPKLNGPQGRLVVPVLQRLAKRLICFEGAIRLGKSWGALILVWCLALLHPGIRILIARWKQEDVDSTLTEVWESVCGLFPAQLQPRWDAAKHAYIFKNGSIVYKKSLKSSEGEARDSKWRGMTLGVIVIDQFEECPKYVLQDIKGRLSQSKHAVTNKPYRYPLHLILLLNSIDEDHYLADEFPTDNSRPNRQYLTGTIWDNRENLGEEVIAVQEENYPVGDPRRRTLLEGKRGLAIDGEPCYAGYFDPAANRVPSLRFNPYLPLLEGWDFSHSHPAVLWAQWDTHRRCLNILGGVQGFSMFLEEFTPKVLEIRYRLFKKCGVPREALLYLPQLSEDAVTGEVDVWSWCDPAGANNTSGSRTTGVTSLKNFGVYPRHTGNANAAPERFAAIQAIGGMMIRPAPDGGRCLRVAPQCIELRKTKAGVFVEKQSALIVDAFSLAYTWDDKAPPDSNPNVRRPRKNFAGDKYSHLMNGLEYVVLGEGLFHRPTDKEMRRAEGRLRAAGQAVANDLRQQALVHPVTGERMLTPEEIREFNRRNRDHDPADDMYADWRRQQVGGRSSRHCGSRAGYP